MRDLAGAKENSKHLLTLPQLECPCILSNAKWSKKMQKFSVPDMTCGHCTKTIEAAITGLDSAAKIETDLDQHVIAVTSSIDTEKMIGTLKEAGYPATLI